MALKLPGLIEDHGSAITRRRHPKWWFIQNRQALHPLRRKIQEAYRCIIVRSVLDK